jgi:hypothetical protein
MPRKDNKETTIKMVCSFPPEERAPFSQPRKDDAPDAVARAPSQCLSARVMERHNNQKYVAMAHFSISSLNQNQNLFHSNMSPLPTLLNDACPAVSPTIFLNDASSSDEEEEQRLFTQPEAEAEAIDDLMAANTKKSDPPKCKATPPGKTSKKKKKKKKKKRCDISDADLDAQLKQVSTKNANDSLLHADDSLLHAATEDNKTKRVTSTSPCLF